MDKYKQSYQTMIQKMHGPMWMSLRKHAVIKALQKQPHKYDMCDMILWGGTSLD